MRSAEMLARELELIPNLSPLIVSLWPKLIRRRESTFERLDERERGRVPQFDRPVFASGRQDLAVVIQGAG